MPPLTEQELQGLRQELHLMTQEGEAEARAREEAGQRMRLQPGGLPSEAARMTIPAELPPTPPERTFTFDPFTPTAEGASPIPSEVSLTPQEHRGAQPGGPTQRALAAITLPTAAALATGSASVPVAVGVDALMTALNIGMGLEQFDPVATTASIFVPEAFRQVSRLGTKAMVRPGTRRMRMLAQEQKKLQADTIERNFKILERDALIEGIPKDQAMKDAINRANSLIEFQGRRSAIAHSQLVNRLPIVADEGINTLYEQARRLNPEIDIAVLRDVQDELAGELAEIRQIFPRMNDPLLGQLSARPGQESMQFAGEAIDPASPLGQAVLAQTGGEALGSAVPFSSVTRSLKVLGEMGRSLSKSVATSPGAATDLRNVYRVRGALLDALNDAAKNTGVAQEARNALRVANATFFQNETLLELQTHLEKFKTVATTGRFSGLPVFDPRAALASLTSPKTPDAVELVKNLRTLGKLDDYKSFMTQIGRVQDRAARKIDLVGRRQQQRGREGSALRRQGEITAREAAALRPGPGEEITPGRIGLLRMGMFTAASAAASGIALSTDTPISETFGITMGIASGASLIPLLSIAMMSPAGQKFLLKQLERSQGRMDARFMGALGAFTRASGAQIVAPEEIILPSPNTLPRGIPSTGTAR